MRRQVVMGINTGKGCNAMTDCTLSALSLRYCLERQSWHTLRALARAVALPFDSNWPKPEAIERLATYLGQVAYLRQSFGALSSESRAALRRLVEAGGQLSQGDFTYHSGELRPYRPWKRNASPSPWTAPGSPAEELLYKGLIFPLDLGTRSHPLLTIVVPVEYRDSLWQLLGLHPATFSAPLSSHRLFEHLFQWLSFLNRTAVRPLHGRWLPPGAFRQIALLIGEPAGAAATAGSERQVPYLAFLHYLAECAGLVTLNGAHLRPTAVALGWLDAPQRSRWEHLWRSWGAPGPENVSLWKRYELPLADEPDPPQRFQQVCKLLAALPPQGEALTFYLNKARETDPALFRSATSYQSWTSLDPEAQADYAAGMAEALTRLLRGPLAWFGSAARR